MQNNIILSLFDNFVVIITDNFGITQVIVICKTDERSERVNVEYGTNIDSFKLLRRQDLVVPHRLSVKME